MRIRSLQMFNAWMLNCFGRFNSAEIQVDEPISRKLKISKDLDSQFRPTGTRINEQSTVVIDGQFVRSNRFIGRSFKYPCNSAVQLSCCADLRGSTKQRKQTIRCLKWEIPYEQHIQYWFYDCFFVCSCTSWRD